MSKEKQARKLCEAPKHVDECSGFGETKDHFTPKCIAEKLLKWTNKEINASMNIQYLSQPCHAEKDKTTPARFQILDAQLRGAEVFFGEHTEIFNRAKSVKEIFLRIKVEE